MEKSESPKINEIRLLRASEVAQILNVSKAFAYRLMQQGRIRSVIIEKAVRVRPEDLQTFIEQHLTSTSK